MFHKDDTLPRHNRNCPISCMCVGSAVMVQTPLGILQGQAGPLIREHAPH
eukprot:m.148212 g.148212  ORF g.148212 m.148212 type:complete len:50 (-) comp14995_c0_seq23:1976-2125(-)